MDMHLYSSAVLMDGSMLIFFLCVHPRLVTHCLMNVRMAKKHGLVMK